MNMTNPTTAKPERFLPRDLHRALEIHPRHWQIDDDTLSRYVQAIRNGAKLPPPLLWQDEDDLGSPPLVIDGWHRIKAIEKVSPGRKIPCIVFTGRRREALDKAIELNSQHGLPLTMEERQNAAWKLVRERPTKDEEHAFSKKRIVILTGVSKGTVDNMRKRWLALQADCCTATGDWWRDRKNEWQAPEGDEADERVEALAQAVRQLVLDHHRGLQQDQLLDAIMSGMGHKLGGAFIDRHADMSASHLRSIEIEEEQREAREDERRRQALYAEMFD